MKSGVHPPTLCPLDHIMSVIGGKWKSTILCKLGLFGPMRFNVLLREVTPISSRILSKQLKEMESDGIIERDAKDYGVSYSITPKGESLLPVLRVMLKWSLDNRPLNTITSFD